MIGDYGVRLGLNNRVFFQDEQTDSQEFAYRPSLLGGSISYDLQMKSIGCNCLTGLYLVGLNADQCNYKEMETDPNCAQIDIFRGNKHGFNTAAAYPCKDGNCAQKPVCELKTRDIAMAYGFGDQYKINTDNEIQAKTEFISNHDKSKLLSIKTTLMQDGNSVVMETDGDCADSLVYLTDALKGGMGIGFSNYDPGFEVANEVQGTCYSSLNRNFNIAFESSGSSQDTMITGGACRTIEDG